MKHGIWHVPFKGRNYSGPAVQNFLWQQGPVYVMDNHRAAWWCWLREIEGGKPIDLFHMDRHTDTLASRLPEWLMHLPSTMRGVALDEYLSFKYMAEGYECPVIRWDNYLTLFIEAERANLRDVIFATHQDGDRPRLKDGKWMEVPPWYVPGNLDYWISEGGDNWIVNVDLDYFFVRMTDGHHSRFVSSEYIRETFTAVRKHLARGRIKVLTLCLTPDDGGFCGGWKAAEELCREICEVLEIEFQLPSS